MIYTGISYEQIKKWLKENLNEERYAHSLGTAECASNLAKKYDLDKNKAYLAGLLHDCAKCFSTEKLLNLIETNKLNLEEGEKENYKTLHAPVSALIAKQEFNINDSEILSAIRWHTIGKLQMSTFEKRIYLADKIEPKTREKENSKIMYELLNQKDGLDKAILESYKITILSLVKRNLKICPLTIEIYNSMQKKLQKL